MPVLNLRRMAGILLPACSTIFALLLVPASADAQIYIAKDSAATVATPLKDTSIRAEDPQLMKRLNGVILENKAGSATLSTLNIFGLGERYNQFLFNGAPMTSFDPTTRAYPLDGIPAELIEKVSLYKNGNPAVSADYAGGIIDIRTKDTPESDFFYLKIGGGFSDATNGKDFYSDKRGTWEALSFPGSIRNLPGAFPTTRSPYSLDQLNPQEQVDRSRLLKNNLAPINHGATKPNDQVLLSFGRNITLKKGQKIGILALLNQQSTERIDESTLQVDPELTPTPLIRSFANDLNYKYASQLVALLNTSLGYGKNKISLRNYFTHRFSNTYTRQTQLFKPGEDSLAHAGINYLTEQTTYLNTQLSGEHTYGGEGKFKLNWLASYAYYNNKNPDERNFLLRQDSTNAGRFEIAHPQTVLLMSNSDPSNVYTIDPSFTNSGRLWRNVTDHNFTGKLDLLVPFHIADQEQIISGGVGLQARYRVQTTDLLQTSGPGYYPLNELLAPERYYPGGLHMNNYYINGPSVYAISNSAYIDNTNRGNYSASSNTGFAYLKLEDHLFHHLLLNWGLRMESNSQLVSSTQYSYSPGYKNPQMITIDENTRVTKTDLLPSVALIFQPLTALRIHAEGFRTVNRPQLQQLSSYRHYDAPSFMVTSGNPQLQNTLIDNYEAGIDWTPFRGAQLSIAGFYKRMDKPIENVLAHYSSLGNLSTTPYNTPPADLHGINAALNSKLASTGWLSDISIVASGTWLSSTVSAGSIRNISPSAVAEHTLAGSPNYTMNAGLLIQSPRLPMLTLLYNRMGDYISVVGTAGLPDYRIKGREQLDLQLAQKLFRSRMQLTVGVNNLSNSPYIEYQDLNGNKKFDQPLTLTVKDNSGGYFSSGVDNTVMSIKPQRTWYLTISYLFR